MAQRVNKIRLLCKMKHIPTTTKKISAENKWGHSLWNPPPYLMGWRDPKKSCFGSLKSGHPQKHQGAETKFGKKGHFWVQGQVSWSMSWWPTCGWGTHFGSASSHGFGFVTSLWYELKYGEGKFTLKSSIFISTTNADTPLQWYKEENPLQLWWNPTTSRFSCYRASFSHYSSAINLPR